MAEPKVNPLYRALRKLRFWQKAEVVKFHEFETPLEWLDVDIHRGLDKGEADRRQKLCGHNELQASKTDWFARVMGYFKGPILYGQ